PIMLSVSGSLGVAVSLNPKLSVFLCASVSLWFIFLNDKTGRIDGRIRLSQGSDHPLPASLRRPEVHTQHLVLVVMNNAGKLRAAAQEVHRRQLAQRRSTAGRHHTRAWL